MPADNGTVLRAFSSGEKCDGCLFGVAWRRGRVKDDDPFCLDYN